MTENNIMGDPEVPKVEKSDTAEADDAAEAVPAPIFIDPRDPRAAARNKPPERDTGSTSRESLPPTREEEWMAALAERLGDKTIDEDKRVEILRNLNVPYESIPSVLGPLGVAQDEIESIMLRKNELGASLTEEELSAPDEPNLDGEDIAKSTESAKELLAELEATKTVDPADPDNPIYSPTEDQWKRIDAEKSKMHKLLFDEELGLFRKKDRFRRLFVKPVVGGLFAAIITYMILLNAMTKNAQKRAGSG